MSTLPTMVVTPSGVADAYAKVGNGDGKAEDGGFGNVLYRALQGAVQTGQRADTQAVQAIQGQGNLTDVVTALSQAELTLQAATAIRDRVVQAYQDIMKMPI